MSSVYKSFLRTPKSVKLPQSVSKPQVVRSNRTGGASRVPFQRPMRASVRAISSQIKRGIGTDRFW